MGFHGCIIEWYSVVHLFGSVQCRIAIQTSTIFEAFGHPMSRDNLPEKNSSLPSTLRSTTSVYIMDGSVRVTVST
jgi:hypothetical protein